MTVKIAVVEKEGRSREGEGQKMVVGEGQESTIDDWRVTVGNQSTGPHGRRPQSRKQSG
jgi:hypothetical protein